MTVSRPIASEQQTLLQWCYNKINNKQSTQVKELLQHRLSHHLSHPNSLVVLYFRNQEMWQKMAKAEKSQQDEGSSRFLMM